MSKRELRRYRSNKPPFRMLVDRILVLTVVYTLLLTIFCLTFLGPLVISGFPVAVVGMVVLYVAGIAVAQVFLFRGEAPVLASLVAGGVLGCVTVLEFAVFTESVRSTEDVIGLYMFAVVTIPFGCILGFLIGRLIAGVAFVVTGGRKPSEEDIEEDASQASAGNGGTTDGALLPKSSSFDNPVGVPRQFSVGALMIFATLYSGLFAALSTVGFPPSVFVAATLFVTGVGLSQMLLFGGKEPRKASILTGAISFFVLAEGMHLYYEMTDSYGGSLQRIIEMIPIWFGLAVVIGSGLGYLTGGLAAGIFIFLTRDRVAAQESEQPPASPWTSHNADTTEGKQADP